MSFILSWRGCLRNGGLVCGSKLDRSAVPLIRPPFDYIQKHLF